MRIGDDEGALRCPIAGAKGRAHHLGVVAGAGGLEIAQVHGVVDMTERVGVREADLYRVLIAEVALNPLAPLCHDADDALPAGADAYWGTGVRKKSVLTMFDVPGVRKLLYVFLNLPPETSLIPALPSSTTL